MEINLSKLLRQDIEDKLYQLNEENVGLKKHGHVQDEKMKRLATKILRLKSDMKRIQAGKPTKYTNENEVVDELKMQIAGLEQEVTALQQKLKLSRNAVTTPEQQNKSRLGRSPGYGFVEPRVDTGLPYKPGGVVTPGKRTPAGHVTPGHVTPAARQHKPPSFPQYGQSMLTNARQEIEQLDEIVDQLKYQIQVLEDDKQDLLNKQQDLELTYENKLLALREQLLEQQRTGISEDIDLINVQRQLKERDDKMFDSDAKLLKVRNELSHAKTDRDRAENDVHELKAELEKLHSKLRTTRHQADDSFLQSQQAHELSVALEEVQTERDMLKLENSRLLDDVFDVEKEKVYKQNERKLRDRVKQLEHRLERFQSTPVKVTDEHDEVFDKYITERDRASDLEHQVNKLDLQNRELQTALDKTQELFEDEQRSRLRERDAAARRSQSPTIHISHVPSHKTLEGASTALHLDTSTHEPGTEAELQTELCALQTEYANLVLELDKYKMLLETEYKLKKVYQEEVGAVTSKYEGVRREHAKREDETAKLLDIRAHKINKLELQLRDIAYGTKQVKIEPTTDSENPTDYNISLERGQNVLEIHIGKLYTAHDSLVKADERLFVVLNFYHFQTIITKVMSAAQPDFNTTSQYIVNVDDFLLKALQHDTASLYLYTSSGVEFRCVAVCQLHLKELLNQAGGTRVHGSLQLIGTLGDMSGMVYANIEYHIRLKFPMTHSLLLYKERLKANTYLSTNLKHPSQAEPRETPDTENYNELKITVVRCGKLTTSTSTQPSAYIMYKFYTFADHDTPIIHSSNDPQFNDVKVYPVTTDGQLHRYLSQAQCRIFAFNDQTQDYLLGTADISLIPLAHGNAITGLFELKNGESGVVGVVEVRMEWVVSYQTPRGSPDVITPTPDSAGYGSAAHCDVDTATQHILPEHYAKVGSEHYTTDPTEHYTLHTDPSKAGSVARPPPLQEERVREERRDNAQPRPSQVTFNVEEAQVARVEEVKEVDTPRTDFLSFRSLQEYERAVSKPAQDSDSDIIEEELAALADDDIDTVSAKSSADALPYKGMSRDVDAELPQKQVVTDTIMSRDTSMSRDTDKSYADVVKEPVPVATSTPGIAKLKKLESLGNEFDESSSEDDDVVLGTFEAKPTTPVPTPEPALYPDPLDIESQLQPLSNLDLGEETGPLTPLTPLAGVTALDNTFFEEEPDSDDDIVIPSVPSGGGVEEDETLEQITEHLISSEEDDLVVVSRDTPRDLPRDDTLDSQFLDTVSSETPDPTPRAPPLVVIVHYINFEKEAHFIGNTSIEQVFVEYNLLGVEDADTETPQSLHIKPDIKLYFNFRKTFYVEKKSPEWGKLCGMVAAPSAGGIKFTIWSDPGDTTDADCTPLCSATVQIPTGTDICDNEIPLMSEKLGTNVGVICLTIETKSALEALGLLHTDS